MKIKLKGGVKLKPGIKIKDTPSVPSGKNPRRFALNKKK